MACFGYPLGTLQIAGHVASLTFPMRSRCVCVCVCVSGERLSSEGVRTEAKGGPGDDSGLVCGLYVYL